MRDTVAASPFEATFESLTGLGCPDWFRDAKLGIWSHWGPQSVPRYGDWYARNMYREGSDQYRYHLRTYEHPSEFGYKDVVPLWRAERYFVAQAVHRDSGTSRHKTSRSRGSTLYAFQMAWPSDGRAVIRTPAGRETSTGVRLLGHGPVQFKQPHNVLVVRLPDSPPLDVANRLAIDLADSV